MADSIIQEKFCLACETLKPLIDFYQRVNGRISAYCKRCSIDGRKCTYERRALYRFWKFVQISADGCWYWKGANGDYGSFTYMGRYTGAHRVAYTLLVGPVPDGMQVLHRCDNPPCVRPDHLFTGTHADNMGDKAQKRRAPFGVNAPCANITPVIVKEIRRLSSTGMGQRTIARTLRLKRATVRGVVEGVTWKSVV